MLGAGEVSGVALCESLTENFGGLLCGDLTSPAMWLFTQHGFYSIVADRDHPGRHLARARIQRDLENLKKLAGLAGEIRTTPEADYAFRVSLDANELLRVMTALANTVDYPNFKAAVARRPDQAGRSGTYHRIWTEAAKLQEKNGD